MAYEIDRFKVNWTEKIRGKSPQEPDETVVSVTGYEYQISSWKKNYIKEYDPKIFKTKTITKMTNDDNTVTITVSRLSCPRRGDKQTMKSQDLWREKAIMNSDKNLNNELEKKTEEESYSDLYDDRWDQLYDDIDWQKHRTKIRKSERKEGNKNNKQDW